MDGEMHEKMGHDKSMPQTPPTPPSSLPCDLHVSLVYDKIKLYPSPGTLDVDAQDPTLLTIVLNADSNTDKVVFKAKDFQSGQDMYRVEASSISGSTQAAWLLSPTGEWVSEETLRLRPEEHTLYGQLEIKVFGPLDPNGNSTQEVDTVKPATTIIFEGDLGGLLGP